MSISPLESFVILYHEDMEAARQFYEGKLGLELREVTYDWFVGYWISSKHEITLCISSSPEECSRWGAKGKGVVVDFVVADVDTTYQQLLSQGVEFLEPPTDMPWRLRTASFLDPAGYTLTITSYPKGRRELKHNSMEITYHPIGTIHSPFTDLSGMPIQPSGEASAAGTVDMLPELIQGLKDLEGFSHIILLYHLHKVERVSLTVTPFLGSETHGLFATRAPTRPNPIGSSVVRLVKIEGSRLYVENLDILDGTPLLDIKPYVPEFDGHSEARIGWLEAVRGKIRSTRSDERFQ